MRSLALATALTLSLSSSLLFSSQASAASFGCESVGGSVIFKDTLYGALTGTVIAGLGLLAAQGGGGDAGSIAAGGAALGGLAGLGLGIAEVSLRECPPDVMIEQKGFRSSMAPMLSPDGKLGAGLKLSLNF